MNYIELAGYVGPVFGDDSDGDQNSLDFYNLLGRIASNHRLNFQWVPSHVEIDGNEKAHFLARTAAEEEVSTTGSLTFSELSSLKRRLNSIIL
ncbi:hypothetical protein TNCV_283051 [Trichonephila clavipes]|nr:hypothetical protein TNCV_283051 [Trichonephila clavipes]